MKRTAFILCMLMAVYVRAGEREPGLDDLAWLAGCWQGGQAGSEYVEQWMSPGGRTMLGMSRTVADGKTVAYEFLRIHHEADGIYYTSNPSGQSQASFKLIECKDGRVVFENATHDFPQRIIYQVDKDGLLMASIEGIDKGNQKKVDFPMRRAQCK